MKACNECKVAKPLDAFSKEQSCCKDCISAYNRKYHLKNREVINKRHTQYNQDNKDIIAAYQKVYTKQWREDNKEKIREDKKGYNQDNKEMIRENKRRYKKQRLAEDPVFKVREYVSSSIRNKLRSVKVGKGRKSAWLDGLNYSPQELHNHLQSLFEPWMTWENWSVYDVETWDDNDPKTWKWQIDHITPQSDLPFTSMEDENFKKCWALSNLRPLSAKQNQSDGVNRIRHSLKDMKS